MQITFICLLGNIKKKPKSVHKIFFSRIFSFFIGNILLLL